MKLMLKKKLYALLKMNFYFYQFLLGQESKIMFNNQNAFNNKAPNDLHLLRFFFPIKRIELFFYFLGLI